MLRHQYKRASNVQTSLYKTNKLQIRILRAFETHETKLKRQTWLALVRTYWIWSHPYRTTCPFPFFSFPSLSCLHSTEYRFNSVGRFGFFSLFLSLSLAVRLPLSFSDRVPRCVVSFPTNWTRLRRSSSRWTCVPVCWPTCVSTSGPLLIIMPGEAVRQGTARAFLTFHLLAAKEPVKDQWLSSPFHLWFFFPIGNPSSRHA